jgi:hypothetical protein
VFSRCLFPGICLATGLMPQYLKETEVSEISSFDRKMMINNIPVAIIRSLYLYSTCSAINRKHGQFDKYSEIMSL